MQDGAEQQDEPEPDEEPEELELLLTGSGLVTVTLVVADLPLDVSAVIVAVPALLAVILPAESTVATLGFELV